MVMMWDTWTQDQTRRKGAAVSTALTEHTGPWTIADVEALPDRGDHTRYELLATGVLTVSAAPEPVHQRASRRLANLLESAATAAVPNVEILEAVNVIIPGGRLCIPDIAIVDRDEADPSITRFSPGSVLAVVEIVSPSTTTTDRVVKPDLYAAAKVRHYFRLELEKSVPELLVFELRRSGRHVHLMTAPAGERTKIEIPFSFDVDPADLVAWPQR
jgi:Uma2 family endonuclease